MFGVDWTHGYDRTDLRVTGLDARVTDYCICGFQVAYHTQSPRERAVAEAVMQEHLRHGQ